MIDGKINPFVENMLDFTARRQQALVSNIANIDTPGYKAKDVIFKDELSGAAKIQLIETEGIPKSNGNNVDIESQMTELTKNGLQYVMLVQYMNSQVKSLKTSILEGR